MASDTQSQPNDQPEAKGQSQNGESELFKIKKRLLILWHENAELQNQLKKVKIAHSKREEALQIKNAGLRKRLIAHLDLCASNYRLKRRNMRLQKRLKRIETEAQLPQPELADTQNSVSDLPQTN